MLQTICHTCNTRRRMERREVAADFIMEHAQRGHRVTRRPLEGSAPVDE